MAKVIDQKINVTCDQQTAFDFFTQNAQLEKWLVEEADIQPMMGGKYELFWDTQNKMENSTIGCRIMDIEMPHTLAFDWKGPPTFSSFMNEEEALTQVRVSFLPVDGAVTEIHLRHTGWQDGEEWEAARQWFDQVWAKALHELGDIAGK